VLDNSLKLSDIVQNIWALLRKLIAPLVSQADDVPGHAMHFMGRSMDWTLEDNMVDGLFFCATLDWPSSVCGWHVMTKNR